MAGRKPVPTALKVLRGNPGRRPLNENEPEPETALPPCPPYLDKVARKEWRVMGEKLRALGLLTEIDRTALALYCQTWSRWVDAQEQLRKYGPVVFSKKTGFPTQSPYLTISNQATALLKALLVEFGMTPSSRSRISVAKGRKNDERKERFFGAK